MKTTAQSKRHQKRATFKMINHTLTINIKHNERT